MKSRYIRFFENNFFNSTKRFDDESLNERLTVIECLKSDKDQLNLALFDAMKTPLNSKQIIARLLELKADVNQSLQMIAEEGSESKEAVPKSEQFNKDLNTYDNSGWSPLMNAIARGEAAVVQALLDAKADPNFTGGGKFHKYTPTHIVAYCDRDLSFLAPLVKAKANLGTPSESGLTPLNWAVGRAEGGKTPTVEAFTKIIESGLALKKELVPLELNSAAESVPVSNAGAGAGAGVGSGVVSGENQPANSLALRL